MPTRKMLSVQAQPDVAHIRTATLFDADHTIVPCVALVEGVLWPANAPAPELALAEEFGRFPDGWNGRPVVFDHPHINGMAVSASHPDVMEDVAFGQLFNTSLDETKLKTEIWINNERVQRMSAEVQDAVSRLKNGEMVEVSTGLFTMTEKTSGEFQGEEFEAIWRNIVPDHLAVLPEGVTGACSVEDGCGAPRANEARYVMNAQYIPTTNTDTTTTLIINTPVEDCECDDDMKKTVYSKIMGAVGNILGLTEASPTSAADEVVDNHDGSIQENSTMKPKDQLVEGLIANEATQYSEDDRDWLSTLEESQLARMSPVVNEEEGGKEGEELPEAAVTEEPAEEVEEPAVNAAPTPVSTEDYIASAPSEIREVLDSGLRMHRARKQKLVDGILANKRNTFSKEQLCTKGLDELEAIASLAEDISYEGNAPTGASAHESADDAPPPAPDVLAAIREVK